jgi:methylated-DNA-[protein]-cysteine S-methyltransferase
MPRIPEPVLESFWPSPVGGIQLQANRNGLVYVGFAQDHGYRTARPNRLARAAVPTTDTDATAVLRQTEQELAEYFAGTRQELTMPLDLAGTEFQISVWEALLDIPYGTTTSYRELAARVGRPKAVRAVAAANGANPISIVVPCHRVVGSDGSLTGYGGGLEAKRFLLALERRGPIDGSATRKSLPRRLRPASRSAARRPARRVG